MTEQILSGSRVLVTAKLNHYYNKVGTVRKVVPQGYAVFFGDQYLDTKGQWREHLFLFRDDQVKKVPHLITVPPLENEA